jgi:hypothetical protein
LSQRSRPFTFYRLVDDLAFSAIAAANRFPLPMAKQYESQGLNMLFQHAQFEDKSVSVEAGLLDMLTRMEAGKFKVFAELKDWFEECRLYHRKDGRVHKEHDDLMSATRYAVMMLRFAECLDRPGLSLSPPPRSTVRGPGSWMVW